MRKRGIKICADQHQLTYNKIIKKMSMKNAKIITKSIDWVDKECHSFPNIKILGSTIEALDKVDIFGKSKFKLKYSFTIKIIKMKYSIGIGVVDSSYSRRKVWSDNSRWICYCNDSLFWDGQEGIWQGKGFTHEESVTVNVDLVKGTIQWRVEDELRHFEYNVKLKDRTIEWVPYFWLCKDSVAMIMK